MPNTKLMNRNQNHDNMQLAGRFSRFVTLVVQRLGMAKRKPMTRNQNHDDAPWSDIDHNLLFLVMMQLGVVDFLSFGGVCKSWRLLATSNRNMFMASKPPMSVHILSRTYNNSCYLKDLEGRKFKTIIPDFGGAAFVGLTCGYLIFFAKTTSELWLVNPITRHELHFPDFVVNYALDRQDFRAILVFSPSISGWVFFLLPKGSSKIWFSISGKGGLNPVSCIFPVIDLCVFKGKIYTLSRNTHNPLCELRLNPKPILTLIETKNFASHRFFGREFVSLGENLYLMGDTLEDPRSFLELDFGEMKWVAGEKTAVKYAFFSSILKGVVAVKRGSWDELRLYNEGYVNIDVSGRIWVGYAGMWYFPHQCLNVDLINE